MKTKYYPVNNRQLTAFSSLDEERSFSTEKNYLFDLDCLGLIDVLGEKSSEFLQGQLSCDLREVTTQQMRQGALCNLKGRVLALMDIVDWQGLHLILPNDLLDETQSSLAKTALFSKVKLSRASAFELFGFHLQNNQDLIPFDMDFPEVRYGVTHNDFAASYHLDKHFFILMVRSEHAASLKTLFETQGQLRGSLPWHELRLQNQQIEIYPESRGVFLPHRLGLHLTGHLNFNKGCYKGQEIIARTHYRAKQKHEMKLFTIQTSEPLTSGSKLFNHDGSVEIGELIDYCPTNKDTFLIAASMVFNHPETILIENHQSVTPLFDGIT